MLRIDERIQQAADLFDLDPALLVGPSRSSRVVRARWALMWVLRERGWSFTEIGAYVGGRDHQTVIYGVRQAEARAMTDEGYALALAALR